MESSCKQTSPYIQFLFSAEPAEFFVDTNLTLRHFSGNIFIALAYPKLIVEVEGQKIVIDCQQPNFHAEPDEYPLYAFLSLYPEHAEQIVRCHEAIKTLFEQYLVGQWDNLMESQNSQKFLENEAKRIRCLYCLPKEKGSKEKDDH